jgi:hypothetical protein
MSLTSLLLGAMGCEESTPRRRTLNPLQRNRANKCWDGENCPNQPHPSHSFPCTHPPCTPRPQSDTIAGNSRTNTPPSPATVPRFITPFICASLSAIKVWFRHRVARKRCFGLLKDRTGLLGPYLADTSGSPTSVQVEVERKRASPNRPWNSVPKLPMVLKNSFSIAIALRRTIRNVYHAILDRSQRV